MHSAVQEAQRFLKGLMLDICAGPGSAGSAPMSQEATAAAAANAAAAAAAAVLQRGNAQPSAETMEQVIRRSCSLALTNRNDALDTVEMCTCSALAYRVKGKCLCKCQQIPGMEHIMSCPWLHATAEGPP